MVLYLLMLYVIAIHVVASIRQNINTKTELFFMMLGVFVVLGFRNASSGTDTWN